MNHNFIVHDHGDDEKILRKGLGLGLGLGLSATKQTDR